MTRLPRPKLNKNYSEIGHGDAMTAIIQDSTTASSGEEQQIKSPIHCSRNSAHSDFKPYQVLPYDEKKANPNKSTTTSASNTAVPSSAESSSEIDLSKEPDLMMANPIKRDLSQTILTDTITTGASYR